MNNFFFILLSETYLVGFFFGQKFLVLYHSEDQLKIDLFVDDSIRFEVHNLLIFFWQVWHNIRTACGNQAHLIHLAETLSQKFEVLHEKEVWYRSASLPSFIFSSLDVLAFMS
jgi:hypothetical protein